MKVSLNFINQQKGKTAMQTFIITDLVTGKTYQKEAPRKELALEQVRNHVALTYYSIELKQHKSNRWNINRGYAA